MEVQSQKDILRDDTVKYQVALEKEIDKLLGSAKNTTYNTLVIVGTLTTSYLLFKKLTRSKSKKKEKGKNKAHASSKAEKSSFFSSISDMLLKELTLYILMYAKQKILEYLENIKEDNE